MSDTGIIKGSFISIDILQKNSGEEGGIIPQKHSSTLHSQYLNPVFSLIAALLMCRLSSNFRVKSS